MVFGKLTICINRFVQFCMLNWVLFDLPVTKYPQLDALYSKLKQDPTILIIIVLTHAASGSSMSGTKCHPCPRDHGKNATPKGPCLEPPKGQGPEARGRLQAGARGCWHYFPWAQGHGVAFCHYKQAGRFTIVFQNAMGIICANHVIKSRMPWATLNRYPCD